MNEIAKTTAGPVIRHGLTVLSGYLAAQGLPGLNDGTVSNLNDVLLAASSLVIALGWSIADKALRKPKA